MAVFASVRMGTLQKIITCSRLIKTGFNNVLLHLFQAKQYCSVLLTTMSNVGSATQFNLVFINLEQVIIFCRVGLFLEAREGRPDIV